MANIKPGLVLKLEPSPLQERQSEFYDYGEEFQGFTYLKVS